MRASDGIFDVKKDREFRKEALITKISDLPCACVPMGALTFVRGKIELQVDDFADQPGVWILAVDGDIARITGADTRSMHASAQWWERPGNSDRHDHLAHLLQGTLKAGNSVELFGCQPAGASYVATAREWRQAFSFAWA
ncbi:hypothetical protein MLE19_20730 [Halomonas neptunia]|uniref:Uncharacterized protein n=1 Tax=Vreelandella neptunia TaxID=115551 RepID=A0ABS9SCC0_9GAMM|nr:hypothetical protein [Halomonas neptunia]